MGLNMSLIAYYQGHLITDQCMIVDSLEESQHKAIGKKLYISHFKTVAFSYCGMVIHDEDIKVFMNYFVFKMEMYDVKNIIFSLSEEEKSHFFVHPRQFIIMSRKSCIRICDFGDGIVPMQAHENYAMGTGRMFFYTAAAANMPVDKVIPFASTLFASISKEYDKFDSKHLVPFKKIKEEKVVKP
jgi:hypothetical protein